jgi:hypothetical protein
VKCIICNNEVAIYNGEIQLFLSCDGVLDDKYGAKRMEGWSPLER